MTIKRNIYPYDEAINMYLQIKNLNKTYPTTKAVNNLSISVNQAETLALLGSSGCGKSTLLKLIAGLEPADSGKIFLNEQDITNKSPQERGFGMVFQDYALFPHMTVGNNIKFGLQKLNKAQKQARIKEVLELVGLDSYQNRAIHELSGGEQQRVALARALAPKPKLLLLDEPLSNLDRNLRENLKRELKIILAQLEITAIYVTHDQNEAFALAKQVAIMRQGELLQIGKKEEVFSHPKTAWIAKFLGHNNIYSANELSSDKPALLRSELIGLNKGKLKARIESISYLTELVEIKLLLLDLGINLLWQGFRREISDRLEPNQIININIPKQAWHILEEEK